MEQVKFDPYPSTAPAAGMSIIPGTTAGGLDPCRERRKLLLGSALNSKLIASALVECADKFKLFDASIDLLFIWQSVRDYYQAYSTLPKVHPLLVNLLETRGIDWQSSFSEQDLRGTVKDLYDIAASPPDEAHINDILQEFRLDYIGATAPSRIRESADTAELAELLKQAHTDLTSNPMSRPTISTPFDNIEEDIVGGEKVPFDIPWLDKMLGGGLGYGEIMGSIQPSGCGKTTLAWMLAEAEVTHERRVAYISTEQVRQGDMTIRPAVLASHSKRSDWEAYASEMTAWKRNPVGPKPTIQGFLSEKQLNLYESTSALWRKNLRFVDYGDPTQPILSMEAALEGILDDLARQQFVPNTILLDWWGPLHDRLMAGKQQDNFVSKQVAAHGLNVIRHYAAKHGFRIVIFHQMAGSAAACSPTKKPTSHKAQGNADFNNYMNYCFAGTGKDADGNIGYYLDKARGAESCRIYLKIQGDECRLQPTALDEGSAQLGAVKKQAASSFNAPIPWGVS